MNKTLEKILEDELFETETFEGEGSLQIKNTSEGTKMNISVEGNGYQETRSGKNKFDLSKIKQGTVFGINCKYNEEEQTVSFDGTCTEDNVNFGILTTINIIPTDSVTVYYIGGTASKNEEGSGLIQLQFWDNNLSFLVENLEELNSDNKQKSKKPNANGSCSNITFRFDKGIILNNFTLKVMLAEDTEYEKYGAMPSPQFPSEVKACGDNGNIKFNTVNKNLLKTGLESQSKNGITIEKINESRYKLNGTSTNAFRFLGNNYTLPKNKNFIFNSKLNSGTISEGHVFALLYKGNESMQYYKQLDTGLSEYGTVTNVEIYQFGIYISKGTVCNNVIIDIEIATDDKATDIIPHEEQSISIPTQKPFRKINDYKDTFVKQNGKWYEKHIINRKIFTENEKGISVVNESKGYTRIRLNVADIARNIAGKPNIISCVMSNYFKYNGDSGYNQPTVHIAGNIEAIWIRDDEGLAGITTTEQFNEKLKEWNESGNPLYFDYLRAEPELIECTEEQTKELDKLMQLTAYDDVTNIICEDEIPCNFKVDAKISKIKKLKEQINAQIGE